jgi:hypothetical protein
VRIRTFFASLTAFAVVFICVGSAPKAAENSDFGDPAQVAAIRHDIPILLDERLAYTHRTPVIEWVVSDGYRAVANWDAGDIGGLIALALRAGKWRVVSEVGRDADGWWSPLGYPYGCRHNNLREPSGRELVDANLIDAGLLPSLEQRLVPNVPTTPFKDLIVDCYSTIASQTLNGYHLTFSPHYDDNTRMAFSFVESASDKPSELSSSGDSFRFRIAANDWSDRPSSATATVREGRVTIWVPFVLDAGRTYVLSLDGNAWSVAAIKATVKYNTLTFDLPRFPMRAGTIVNGVVRVNENSRSVAGPIFS